MGYAEKRAEQIINSPRGNDGDEKSVKAESAEEKQAIFDAFADKSVAASKTVNAEKEMDDTTFGKIIEEEIERIKAKSETVSSQSRDE